MAALKQTLHDEGYEEAAEAFTYTLAIIHLDWDLAFLGEHLVDQIAGWCAEHLSVHPPTDERPASPTVARPPFPVIEPPTIPPPPPEVYPEQVIEDNPDLAVRAAESDMSVE